MVNKYFGGALPEGSGATEDEQYLNGLYADARRSRSEVNLAFNFPEGDPVKFDVELISAALMLREKYEDAMEHFAPHTALAEVFRVIDRANKYIDENAPWALAKNMEQNGARLAHVLYNLLEVTRICGVLLMPFIPGSC